MAAEATSATRQPVVTLDSPFTLTSLRGGTIQTVEVFVAACSPNDNPPIDSSAVILVEQNHSENTQDWGLFLPRYETTTSIAFNDCASDVFALANTTVPSTAEEYFSHTVSGALLGGEA